MSHCWAESVRGAFCLFEKGHQPPHAWEAPPKPRGEKYCGSCRELMPMEQFRVYEKGGRWQTHTYCFECESDIARKWREQHPGYMTKYMRQYRAKRTIGQ